MTIPDFSNILIFICSSFLLVVSPGPAFLYILTQTIDRGYKAGISSVFGIETGTLVHILIVAFGLSTVLINSPMLFKIIKYTGIIYLLVLGIKTLLSHHKQTSVQAKSHTTKTSIGIYLGAIILSTFNPKPILFFMVYLPQFITQSKGGEAAQILFLGFLFICVAILWGFVLVFLANRMGLAIKTHLRGMNVLKYVSGSVYIIIGLMSLFMF